MANPVRRRHIRPIDPELADLGRTFASLTRRFARQGRRVRLLAAKADQVATDCGVPLHGRHRRQRAALEAIREEVGYHAAWGRWSSTSDELEALADRILRHRTRKLLDLAVKFEVLAWLLLHDGAVVDTEVGRQVRRFGSELRRLATPSEDPPQR